MPENLRMSRMLHVVAAVALAGLLSACATEAKYKANLATWVGQPEGNLIAAWGPPNGVYESGGAKYLTYVNASSMVLPGVAPTYQTSFVGNTAYTQAYGGSSPTAVDLVCKTTFTIVAESI